MHNSAPIPAITRWSAGQSTQGRPIECTSLSAQANPPLRSPLLLLGAVHGDEVEGYWLLEEALRLYSQSYPYSKLDSVWVPNMNPDGRAANQRWNGRGIDLNRNLPTEDWTPVATNPRYPPGPTAGSEPENQALLSLLNTLKPRAILSIHSFANFQVNCNGPSREWGEVLARVCGYPVTDDIGYPTPGSLGSYTGKERQIPTITLEIERGIPRERVLELHLPTLQSTFEYWNQLV